MEKCVATVVNEQELADLMEEVNIKETIDIGCSFINIGEHTKFGMVIGVSGMNGKSAFIQIYA